MRYDTWNLRVPGSPAVRQRLEDAMEALGAVRELEPAGIADCELREI